MNEIFDRYVADCVPKLGERTQRQTMRHLRVLREAFGHRVPTVDPIKPKDVGRFLDVQTGKQHRNKAVATLSAVMTNAVGRWYVEGCEVNPCLKVVRHESHPRTRYITDVEFLGVHDCAPFAIRLAMDLALLLGQRQGDLLDLSWVDVWPTYIDVTQGKTGRHLGIKITEAVTEVLLAARRRPPMMPRLACDPYPHRRALHARRLPRQVASTPDDVPRARNHSGKPDVP
jgi:hypothetical protein